MGTTQQQKFRFFALLTSLVLMAFSIQSWAKDSNEKYQDAAKLIDVWFEAQKDYADIPAIMGAVVKDQDILWSGAFGQANVEAGLPSNVNTLSSICSISKVFTATAIMKLVDDGKIELDDKVADLLPEYSVIQQFPESGPVTVRTLLNHSSGLPRDTLHSYWSGPDFPFPDKQGLFDSLSSQQTLFPAGQEVAYSNIGFGLLGAIIEEVAGGSYKQYMEEKVFKPLGMENSVVELPSSLYGNTHAIGYSAPNRNGLRSPANFYQTKAMQPATGISTTVMDLSKFAMWQFRLADSDSKEVMHPSALMSMHQAQAQSKRGFGYELFTDANGSKWSMHGGICPGYTSFLKMDVANKSAYTVLVNANRVRALRYVNGLIEIFDRSEKIVPNKNQKTELSEYTGFYDLSPWNSEYYVASWGQDLMLLYLPTESLKYALYQYKHVEGDTFQLYENGQLADQQIHFYRDSNGEVIKVKNEGNYHFKLKGLGKG